MAHGVVLVPIWLMAIGWSWPMITSELSPGWRGMTQKTVVASWVTGAALVPSSRATSKFLCRRRPRFLRKVADHAMLVLVALVDKKGVVWASHLLLVGSNL